MYSNIDHSQRQLLVEGSNLEEYGDSTIGSGTSASRMGAVAAALMGYGLLQTGVRSTILMGV